MSNSTALLHDEYAAEYPYRPQPAIIVLSDANDASLQAGSHSPGQRHTAIIAASSLFLFFAAANFIVTPLMAVSGGPSNNGRDLPLFALFAAIVSEPALLCAWLVFSTGSFWFRAVTCWTAALLLWISWAGGMLLAYWIASWGQVRQDLFLGTLSLPLVALAIQSPLWCFRSYLGWRLVDRHAVPPTDSPLAIRDYMVGTAVVGLSITCARFAEPFKISPNDFWLGMSMVFVFFACGGLFSIVPAMLLIFRLRDWRLGCGLQLLYGLVVALLLAGILDATSPGRLPAFEFAALVVVFVSLAAFLAIGTKIARDFGYSLVISRRSPENDSP